jgi:ABC-type lipoprotein release transport system permease subunit
VIYFPKLDEQRRYLPFPDQFDRRDGAEIVGVVRDTKYDHLREVPVRMAYLPIARAGRGVGVIAVRAAGDPQALADPVRRAVTRVHPDLTATITTLEDDIRETLAQERLVARLLTFFGAIAILLACIGVYGIVAYTVVRRMNEIGIRIALGARRRQVVKMVAAYALRLTAIGIPLGLAAALGTTRLLSALLFGLTPTDSMTMALAAVVMLAIALLAATIPAVRAARMNPVVALRSE